MSAACDLPPRPGFGKAGKPCKVAINAYAVGKFPTAVVHQYDCQIGDDGAKRGLIRKIWNSFALQDMFGKAAPTVLWDGNKLAWSAIELPFGQQMMTVIDLDEDERRVTTRDNKHRVIIRKAGSVPLHIVEAFLAGKVEMDNDVLVGINFLDHLMRETPAKSHINIKRSFFRKDGARGLDGGVEAWKGIFQSVRVAQGGRLLINVDVATACFWSEGTVIDTCLALLRQNNPEDLVQKLTNENTKHQILRELRRIKRVMFFCKHRPRDSDGSTKKYYTIEGFEQNAHEFYFIQKRRNIDGTETEERTNAAAYYLRQWNIRLKYPKLPLIKTKKKGEVYPMELAYIVPGQRYPFKLNERQTSDMIKFTVQRPQQRADHIKKNVEQLGWAKDPVLREYGMEIDTNMLKTNARVMPIPTICYDTRSQESKLTPKDGKWDLRGKKFIRVPKEPLRCWGLMVFGSPQVLPEADVIAFVRCFVTTYIQHGGVLDMKTPTIMYADSRKSVGVNIFELFKKSGNTVNRKPQILMFVVQQKSSQPYNEIKAYCDTQIGVVSQVLQSRHVGQAKPQYCSNVSMKVNAKLGGTTCHLDKVCHPLAGREPTIIIGADVSHAAPGAPKSSYASMVGSTDLPGTRFAAVANTNGYRVELISTANMTTFVCTLLRAFKMCTNLIPKRIFYFRDGVSEGQYAEVLESELGDIKEACRILQPDYQPKVTMTICSKRHHFRFFPCDKTSADKNGNPVPGTIVERDITHPTAYDFYLASHNAIQGTARPVHYQVIHDENAMPVDAFQALVYNTCYTYVRATSSVSLIPATYYAHLASARARAHEVPIEERNTLTTSSEGRHDREPTEIRPLKHLHEHVRAAMWFI